MALVREDLALDGEAAGELLVLPETRLPTTLRFIYATEKREEPEMRALLEVIGDVWHDVSQREPSSSIEAAPAA